MFIVSLETLAVIPARMASTRLPGKPLVEVGGVPLILRVSRNVRACSCVDRVIVATDDERIAATVEADGGEAMMTPEDMPSGGDRVAWVSRRVPSRFVVNVQGDDPLVGPDMIEPIVAALREDSDTRLALLVRRIEKKEEVEDPNIVKAVFDVSGRALYFSRSPVPHPRQASGAVWYKHIGPYAWRRDFLLDFAAGAQTPLEVAESLEMLRVLERGYTIRCVPAPRDTIEIDTPGDLERIEAFLAAQPRGASSFGGVRL